MGLSSLAIHFSRMAEDLIIWSTREFNFIELDNAYCSVSSVMPQMKNPDTLELIRSKSSKIMSNLFNAIMVVKSIPTGYFRDFQDLKPLLKNSFELLHSIIEMLNGIYSTLTINKEHMTKAVNESFILALDLAELLVLKYNIPFRQSHEIVALLVKNSEKPEDMLNKEKIEKCIFDVRNKETKLSDNFTQTLKNLNLCLEKRISQGSPSEKEVKLNIEELIKNKESLHKLFLERLEMIRNVNALRRKTIENILSL
jgi:argininosuccinate lyase